VNHGDLDRPRLGPRWSVLTVVDKDVTKRGLPLVSLRELGPG
jgi:hypothetical protein